jgi:hypothetical protein
MITVVKCDAVFSGKFKPIFKWTLLRATPGFPTFKNKLLLPTAEDMMAGDCRLLGDQNPGRLKIFRWVCR